MADDIEQLKEFLKEMGETLTPKKGSLGQTKDAIREAYNAHTEQLIAFFNEQLDKWGSPGVVRLEVIKKLLSVEWKRCGVAECGRYFPTNYIIHRIDPCETSTPSSTGCGWWEWVRRGSTSKLGPM
jgi:hypothetical protein